MNTTGFIRGYMSKNMSNEDFMEVVRKALSREFENEVKLNKINNKFQIVMSSYRVEMSKETVDEFKSPYRIDRYILEEFERQGFTFDRSRSQYIQYCFGNYSDVK